MNYTVYVKQDEAGRIIAINSSSFVDESWGTKIDEGAGDKYHHAQGNYFEKSLFTEDGVSRYKIVNGFPVERTENEIQIDRSALCMQQPTNEERISALESAMLVMMGGGFGV